MKAICLCAWFLVPIVARAQASEASAAPAFTTSGAFFALSVPDVDASAQWYKEKLGLTTVMEGPRQGKTIVVVLEGGGLIVELIQLADAGPTTKAFGLAHGIVKAGLIVDDLDKTIAALRARGVPIAMGPFPERPTKRSNFAVNDNAAI